MQSANDDLHAQWLMVHQALSRKQQEIIAEIRSYPPPIPACDVQYNYLLEQRTAIYRELRQVETLQQQLYNGDCAQTALAEFVQKSRFIEAR